MVSVNFTLTYYIQPFICTINNTNNSNNNDENENKNGNENENETITQKFYGQWSSTVFLIYISFIFTYNTFAVPLENFSIVSFDCWGM